MCECCARHGLTSARESPAPQAASRRQNRRSPISQFSFSSPSHSSPATSKLPKKIIQRICNSGTDESETPQLGEAQNGAVQAVSPAPNTRSTVVSIDTAWWNETPTARSQQIGVGINRVACWATFLAQQRASNTAQWPSQAPPVSNVPWISITCPSVHTAFLYRHWQNNRAITCLPGHVGGAHGPVLSD
jgi:hypothetical protein